MFNIRHVQALARISAGLWLKADDMISGCVGFLANYKRRWAVRKLCFAAFSLFLVALIYTIPPARGQGLFGTISGEITDSSGAVIPGATVRVTNVGTNVVTTVVTNEAGVYSVPSLNPGTYDVEAAAKGFESAVVKKVVLEVNLNVKEDFVLKVGTTSQTIEVTGTQLATLQTQQTDLSQTVNERQLDELPTQSGTGRSVYSLVYLSAGVSQQMGNSTDNNYMRIDGDRPRTGTGYVLDGASMVQPVWGGEVLDPSVDAMAEFKVETNNMAAEYGNSGGGITIAVTKSGTNQYHGSAYEYNGNEHLDARNFFNEAPGDIKNPYNFNEFGGTLGGRIIRNKLFFFSDYQGIRNHGGTSVANALVPDANFRAGDLGELCTAGFDGTGTCLGSKGQIDYPGTTTPIPYNRITSINPISQNILALFETGGTEVLADGNPTGVNAVSYSIPFGNTIDRFNPRVDYNPSASNHIFFTFHRATGPAFTYLAGMSVSPAAKRFTHTNGNVGTIGWTHIVSSATLNDFHLGYMHRIGFNEEYGQGSTSLADFGFSGFPNCAAFIPNTAAGTKCGTPNVNVTGYASISTVNNFVYEPAATTTIDDTLTRIVGRHTMKAGAQFLHYSIHNLQPLTPTAKFSFNGTETGNAFGDYLTGTLSGNSVFGTQAIWLETHAWSGAGFMQDDFKVTPKLTLNLGLRYQFDQSFHEAHNGDAYFNPYTDNWVQFGVGSNPSTTLAPWDTEFGPRVGLAWNPRWGFVVRAGYGILFPGFTGHGKAGDGQPGPNILPNTNFNTGTNWSNLPPILPPVPPETPVSGATGVGLGNAWYAPHSERATYVEAWNFTVEKQVGTSTTAQVAYVGTAGVHLTVASGYNICQQNAATLQQIGYGAYGATTSPYCSPAAAQQVSVWNLYIWPGYWTISNSIYHSLQLTLTHRFSHGFSLLGNFSWSKLIDGASDDWEFSEQDFYNRRGDRSASVGNLPVRLTVAPTVELPFGPGKRWARSGLASEVVGGWRAGAIYTLSDGNPIAITDVGFGFCNAAHIMNDRPDMIGNPLPSGFHQTITHWFNTSAFDFSGTCPAAGLVDLTGPGDPKKAFGNAPRAFSNLLGPGVNALDLSLGKEFKIPLGEATRLKFEADFYNALNHPNFVPPDAQADANFGTINATSINNRSIQLGLHLYF